MIRQNFSLLAIASAIFISTSALAQDECKDVLVNQVMNTLKVTKDNYYNTAILSTADEHTDSSEKQDAGLGVVIEGIPISLSWSDAKRLKTNISKYYSLSSIAREQSSYLLMSGQETIINAWRDCMSKKGGGLSLRFKPLDGKLGKQSLLYIEYYKPSDPTVKALNLELTSDVYYESADVDIKAGAECLKSGKVFKAGDTCTVLLITKSAWTTMPIVMLVKTQSDADSSIASYSSYLGPRAELVGSSDPWPAKGANVTARTYAYDNAAISPVECFYASDGYMILEKSIKIARRPEGGADVNTCGPMKGADKKEYSLDETGRRLCVQQVNGTPAKSDHYCSLAITAAEATIKWDPPIPTAQLLSTGQPIIAK